MTVRDVRGDADPDDWFDEPTPRDPWSTEGEEAPSVEDWIAEADDTGASARRPPGRNRRVVAAVAGLALALLLGLLAAFGVFSSGRHPTPNPTVAPRTQPAPQTTSTAAQPETPVVPTAPLKPGAGGPEVRKLQRALALVGDSPGAVDGSYGSATTQAVTRFQQTHGLVADGIAGTKTLAALRSALATG